GVAAVIRQRRLARAKEILRCDYERTLRLSTVGHAVGIASPAHFARLFKQAFGMSPGEFRAQL
ncbi:MAG TPA: helix-turn-helix domain-containing protein, partial [Marmoricola sp.]|nr:helix-turn-helix domain-containing protein [Marmoricola sp.]